MTYEPKSPTIFRPSLVDWLAALKLSPDSPVHVVGYFGPTKDLAMFERVLPSVLGSESSPIFENDRVIVYPDESSDDHETFNLGLEESNTVRGGSMGSLIWSFELAGLLTRGPSLH